MLKLSSTPRCACHTSARPHQAITPRAPETSPETGSYTGVESRRSVEGQLCRGRTRRQLFAYALRVPVPLRARVDTRMQLLQLLARGDARPVLQQTRAVRRRGGRGTRTRGLLGTHGESCLPLGRRLPRVGRVYHPGLQHDGRVSCRRRGGSGDAGSHRIALAEPSRAPDDTTPPVL